MGRHPKKARLNDGDVAMKVNTQRIAGQYDANLVNELLKHLYPPFFLTAKKHAVEILHECLGHHLISEEDSVSLIKGF